MPRPYRPGRDDPRYKRSRLALKKWDHTCHRCGHPIDMQLRWPHPLSWSAGHKVPTSHLAPDDPRQWHVTNLQAEHLRCNEAAGNRTTTPPTPTPLPW